jgi:hypothetical protein
LFWPGAGGTGTVPVGGFVLPEGASITLGITAAGGSGAGVGVRAGAGG